MATRFENEQAENISFTVALEQKDEEIERLLSVIRQINVWADDSQNSSALHALDRLARIEKITTIELTE